MKLPCPVRGSFFGTVQARGKIRRCVMGFRTLEISGPSEVHVHRKQLVITNEQGTFSIPLEDLTTIVCSGANIRMSTMAQARITGAGITMMIINEAYRPACMILPVESHVRQTLVMRRQIAMPDPEKLDDGTKMPYCITMSAGNVTRNQKQN